MYRATLTLAALLAGTLLAPALLSADNVPATQPDESAVAPTTQPDELAASTTRPDDSLAADRPSSISYLLTRNLPKHLQAQNLKFWANASEQQRGEWKDAWGSLGMEQRADELKKIIQRKSEFDKLDPKIQQRYRDKAALIKEVLSRMTPSEIARLNTLTPQDRAKRILELAAELKIELPTHAGDKPGDGG